MAWTQADLDKLRAAYIDVVSGAQKVRFADGREVTYHSPDQIAAAIKVVETKLIALDRAKAGISRRRYGIFRSGL